MFPLPYAAIAAASNRYNASCVMVKAAASALSPVACSVVLWAMAWVRSYEPPTRIANAPAFLKGVVNLRGVIVPIVDLRLKLGCDSAEYNHFTVVIVLNVRGRVVGAVVDSVSDVLELAGDTIRPAPAMNSTIDTGFITGIGSVADRMLILMDIEGLMSSTDMGLIDSSVK